MNRDRDEFFGEVLSDGYGVEPEAALELVFVDIHQADPMNCAIRAGALARLLSEGADWAEAAAATGFGIEARPGVGSRPGLRVEFGSASVVLDLFDIAEDPLGAVMRMVGDAGGRVR